MKGIQKLAGDLRLIIVHRNDRHERICGKRTIHKWRYYGSIALTLNSFGKLEAYAWLVYFW